MRLRPQVTVNLYVNIERDAISEINGNMGLGHTNGPIAERKSATVVYFHLNILGQLDRVRLLKLDAR